MSLASLLGALFGFGLIIGAILHATTHIEAFFELSGIMIVFGGTVASAYMSFPASEVNTAFKAIWWMLKKPKASRESLGIEIMRLIKWSYIVQKRGLPALEDQIKSVETNEPLIRFCLTLTLSNHSPQDLRAMMETAIEADYDRKTVAVGVLRSMAANSPTFGMIGTLVGMVVMLQNFSSDMTQLGAAMGLALLATLYGVVFARLVYYPAAFKLEQYEEVERFRNHMIAEGLVLLADKKGPRYMQDRLNSFMNPSKQFDMDRSIKLTDPKAATVKRTAPAPAAEAPKAT